MSQSHGLTPASQNDTRVAGGSTRQINRLCFTWTINNFSLWGAELGQEIRSPTFSPVGDGNVTWCLVVNPNGINEDSKGHVSVFLLLLSSEENEVHAEFKLSIIDATMEETNLWASGGPKRFLRGGYHGCDKFIRRECLLAEACSLLVEGNLVLFCEGSVFTGSLASSEQNPAIPSTVPGHPLHDGLGHSVENQKFRDVVIVVDGQQFHAHKAVLAAASPVFATVFEHDSATNGSTRLDVTDTDHAVFRQVLLFIYTGRVVNIDAMAADLLVAADRFSLGHLKSMCETSLLSHLSVSTSAELLVFADTHGAQDLKNHVIEFIVANSTEVMNTSGWKTMARQQPHLVVEIFRAQLLEPVVPEGPPQKRMRKF
ncbi:hypothetical protein HPB48_005905 [Haemaphysalis longicornis]|uniref:Speckle-type POZ protein n=1 Tax=Haemaphysalis longicornis TaxID=44386 RepID=A0A9J6FKD5_HAELO|nr:hypothetical protein HPB48_005905 [Haemaphysalis longicornis]